VLHRALDVRSPIQFHETTGAVFDTLAQIHLIRGRYEVASEFLGRAGEAYGAYGRQTSQWYEWSVRVLGARLALRQGALDDAFKNVTSNATLQTCPDHTASPGTWHYTKTPTAAAGQLACGTDSDGQANVMWTEDSKEFVALIRGSALPDLFTWWQKKS